MLRCFKTAAPQPHAIPPHLERTRTANTTHVTNSFPHPDYTYDLYVASTGSVRLLDFNPAGGTTAPLLFEWHELGFGGAPPDDAAPANGAGQHANGAGQHVNSSADDNSGHGDSSEDDGDDSDEGEDFELRLVDSHVALRPDKAAYGVPYDFVDTAPGGAAHDVWGRLRDLQDRLQEVSPEN